MAPLAVVAIWAEMASDTVLDVWVGQVEKNPDLCELIASRDSSKRNFRKDDSYSRGTVESFLGVMGSQP